ncbi:MAG: hypothetical protein U0904_02080 [Candidatus Nanopelagicales bacterium]|nr:hypothetical protein [Candidatus Nanopelagicales bacterium]
MSPQSFAARNLADLREGGVTRLWQKLTPLAAKRGRKAHTYHLDLEAARAEATAIRSVLDGREPPAVDVVYDNHCSPPAYGNFMEVVMTARYLAGRGADVRFVIVDPDQRRSDWNQHLTHEGQGLFVRDQVRLASALLGGKAEIALERQAGSASASAHRPADPHRHVLFGELVGSRSAWYSLSPTLLHPLVAEKGGRIAERFLLEVSDFPESVPTVSSHEPYVAWSIRRTGQRGDVRDSTAGQILSDFRSITRRFPSHKIMLFSTPLGLAFAREVLSQRPDYSATINAQLVDQPAADFVGAIPWILGSAFYFQRIGGGMAAVAIFSTVPYRIVLTNTGTFTGLHRGRLASWLRADQAFSAWPVGARYRRTSLGRPALRHSQRRLNWKAR